MHLDAPGIWPQSMPITKQCLVADWQSCAFALSRADSSDLYLDAAPPYWYHSPACAIQIVGAEPQPSPAEADASRNSEQSGQVFLLYQVTRSRFAVCAPTFLEYPHRPSYAQSSHGHLSIHVEPSAFSYSSEGLEPLTS